MGNLKPNGRRAKNAILMIRIVLALEIVLLISGLFQYGLLHKLSSGAMVSDAQANANDLRESILGIVYLGAYIAAAITFILWFRRAWFNLHQKVAFLSWSEGWAAGAWFVPILNFFRPYQIMNEMYRETDSLLTNRGWSVADKRATSFLGWWWALWIINTFIGRLAFRYSMRAEFIDDLLRATEFRLAGNLIGIPLALLAIKVIKDYAYAEPILSEIRSEEELLAGDVDIV